MIQGVSLVFSRRTLLRAVFLLSLVCVLSLGFVTSAVHAASLSGSYSGTSSMNCPGDFSIVEKDVFSGAVSVSTAPSIPVTSRSFLVESSERGESRLVLEVGASFADGFYGETSFYKSEVQSPTLYLGNSTDSECSWRNFSGSLTGTSKVAGVGYSGDLVASESANGSGGENNSTAVGGPLTSYGASLNSSLAITRYGAGSFTILSANSAFQTTSFGTPSPGTFYQEAIWPTTLIIDPSGTPLARAQGGFQSFSGVCGTALTYRAHQGDYGISGRRESKSTISFNDGVHGRQTSYGSDSADDVSSTIPSPLTVRIPAYYGVPAQALSTGVCVAYGSAPNEVPYGCYAGTAPTPESKASFESVKAAILNGDYGLGDFKVVTFAAKAGTAPGFVFPASPTGGYPFGFFDDLRSQMWEYANQVPVTLVTECTEVLKGGSTATTPGEDPGPTPGPGPQPDPQPEPDPDPVPQPDPDPEPDPVPQPDPNPNPDPNPDPDQDPKPDIIPIAVDITLSSETVPYNTTATLTWKTTGTPDSCVASDAWSGQKSIAGGTEGTASLTQNKVYTIICKKAGVADAKDTVEVKVTPQVPTVVASPRSCGSGSIGVSWSQTDLATQYVLYRDGSPIELTPVGPGQMVSEHQGLAPGSFHQYAVVAKNAYGSSAPSATVYAYAPALCQQPLTVTKVGSGTVTSVTNAGTSGEIADGRISCGTDCSESYTHNTIVSLRALPANGYTFGGWSGSPCAPLPNLPDRCAVTMDSAKTVTATFLEKPTSISATLVALPNPVAYNTPTELRWTLGGSPTCTTSWNGTKTVSGSENSERLTAPTAFSMVCTKGGQELTPKVTVNVLPAGTTLNAMTPGSCGSREITVEWTKAPLAKGYRLYINNATTPIEVADTAESLYSYRHQNLSSGGLYIYRVIPFNDFGSGPTAEIAATSDPVCPNPSLNIQFDGLEGPVTRAFDKNSGTLSWESTYTTAPCTATASPASSAWTGNKTVGGTQNLSSIPQGATDYTISCVGRNGTTVTDTVRVVVEPRPASPTVSLLIKEEGSTLAGAREVTVDFAKNIELERSGTNTTFCDAYSDPSSSWLGARSVGTAATREAVTSPIARKIYYFYLDCENTLGESASSFAVLKIRPEPPVVTPKAGAEGTRTITASWGPTRLTDSYSLTIDGVKLNPWELPALVNGSFTYRHTDVIPGSLHSYKVCSINTYGEKCDTKYATGPADPSFELSVTKTGTGTGTVDTVTASGSGITTPGISCGTDCKELYVKGTTVSLRARPTTGHTFAGWIGCDSVVGADSTGTAYCTVRIDTAHTVTASFEQGSISSIEATLTATPTVVRYGRETGTLTWRIASTNTTCIPSGWSATGLSTDASGLVKTGTVPFGPLSKQTTYQMVCTRTGVEGSLPLTAIVNVGPEQPVLTVQPGLCGTDRITASWLPSNETDSYTLRLGSGAPTTYTAGKLSYGSTFSGLVPGGLYEITLASRNAYLSEEHAVVALAPRPCVSVDLKFNGVDGPVELTEGQGGNFTWQSAGADSCTATNTGSLSGWRDGKPLQNADSSAHTLSGLSVGDYTFSLTCRRASDGSEATDTVFVSVKKPDVVLQSILNVQSTVDGKASSGVAVVLTKGAPANFGGVTSYTRTSSGAVDVVLSAPASFQGAGTPSWTGCDTEGTSGATCHVTLTPNTTTTRVEKTIVVNYVTPLSAPVVTARTNASCGGLAEVFWDQVAGATSYKLYASQSATFVPNDATNKLGDFTTERSSANPFLHNTSVPGSTWYYKVVAVRGSETAVSAHKNAVASADCPDFIVTSITYPGYPAPLSVNTPTEFTAVIKNIDGSTALSFPNAFTFNASRRPSGTPSVEGLLKDASASVRFMWQGGGEGPHVLKVCANNDADHLFVIEEFDKSNNCRSLDFGVASANLTANVPAIADLIPADSGRFYTGQGRLVGSINNIGQASVPSAFTNTYSITAGNGTNPTWVSFTPVGIDLAKNGSSVVSGKESNRFVLPSQTFTFNPGEWTLRLCANRPISGAFTESDTTDGSNCAQGPAVGGDGVTILPLTRANIQSTWKGASAGDVSIDHVSGLEFDGVTPYAVEVRRAISATILRAPLTHPAYGGVFVGWTGCDTTDLSDRTCTFSVSHGGSRTLVARYDELRSADLTASLTVSDNSPAENTSITLSGSVTNSGNLSFANTFNNRFERRSRAVSGTTWSAWETWPVGDATTARAIAGIGEGGSATAKKDVPAYTWNVGRVDDRVYEFRLCADTPLATNGVVPETDEGEDNNCSSVPVQVQTKKPQNNSLTVQARKNGVPFSITTVGNPTALGGTTSYTFISQQGITGTISAPSTVSGATFVNWSGCSSVSGTLCTVSVTGGADLTITADYSYTALPNLSLPSLSLTGLIPVPDRPGFYFEGVAVLSGTVYNSNNENLSVGGAFRNTYEFRLANANSIEWVPLQEVGIESSGTSLPPNGSRLITPITLPLNPGGPYIFKLTADKPESIAESNESDNAAERGAGKDGTQGDDPITIIPKTRLNVQSFVNGTLVPGVTVTQDNGFPSGLSGQTTYEVSVASPIDAVLVASPAHPTVPDAVFDGWEGCVESRATTRVTGRCTARVTSGERAILGVHYVNTASTEPPSLTLEGSFDKVSWFTTHNGLAGSGRTLYLRYKATSCGSVGTAGSSTQTSWNGQQSLSTIYREHVVSPQLSLAGTYTYSLLCTTPSGQQLSRQVSVALTQPLPDLTTNTPFLTGLTPTGRPNEYYAGRATLSASLNNRGAALAPSGTKSNYYFSFVENPQKEEDWNVLNSSPAPLVDTSRSINAGEDSRPISGYTWEASPGLWSFRVCANRPVSFVETDSTNASNCSTGSSVLTVHIVPLTKLWVRSNLDGVDAPGVAITNGAGFGGTTTYTKEAQGAIQGVVLTASQTHPQGGKLSGWTGCDQVDSLNRCTVSVEATKTHTVVALYTTTPAPSLLLEGRSVGASSWSTNFSVAPSTSVELRWTGEGCAANAGTASNDRGVSWSGSRGVSGTERRETITPALINGTYAFTLSCFNEAGSVTRTVYATVAETPTSASLILEGSFDRVSWFGAASGPAVQGRVVYLRYKATACGTTGSAGSNFSGSSWTGQQSLSTTYREHTVSPTLSNAGSYAFTLACTKEEGGTLSRTVQVNLTADPDKPDLVASRPSVNGLESTGTSNQFFSGQATLRATVGNSGARSAPGTFLTRYEVRLDGTTVWNAITPDRALVMNSDMRAGELGRAVQDSSVFVFGPGIWHVRACADSGSVVDEISEDNNCSDAGVDAQNQPPIVVVNKPTLIVDAKVGGVTTAVAITGTNGFGGTTTYTKTSDARFTTELSAPQTLASGALFAEWQGCDRNTKNSGRTCEITVDTNEVVRVTATYTPGTTSQKPDITANHPVPTGLRTTGTAGEYYSGVATLRGAINNIGTNSASADFVSRYAVAPAGTDLWTTIEPDRNLADAVTAVSVGASNRAVQDSSGFVFNPGTWAVRLCADSGSVVDEISEDNNCSDGSGKSGTGGTDPVIITIVPDPDTTTRTLVVSTAGRGSGSVTSSPAGISCTREGNATSGDCSQSYANATSVTLTPTADTNSSFGGWSGSCTGTGACTIVMTADQAVTATFTSGGDGTNDPTRGDGNNKNEGDGDIFTASCYFELDDTNNDGRVNPGEEVTWIAQIDTNAVQNPVRYLWGGTPPLAGRDGSRTTVIYNENGTKVGSVTVTDNTGRTDSAECTVNAVVQESGGDGGFSLGSSVGSLQMNFVDGCLQASTLITVVPSQGFSKTVSLGATPVGGLSYTWSTTRLSSAEYGTGATLTIQACGALRENETVTVTGESERKNATLRLKLEKPKAVNPRFDEF